MATIGKQIDALSHKKQHAVIQVRTLGAFSVWRSDHEISTKEWGRDATVQLFQFFITNRQRHGLHKEQIIDRLWGDLDPRSGLQNFKVAHHGLNKVLDPQRQIRTSSRYIIRQGASYYLKLDEIWIDADIIDQYILIGNQCFTPLPDKAIESYQEAIKLYKGLYLPNRIYDDWSSEERERIQLLILGALINLSELLVKDNPMESVRLTQQALQIDHTWEDAYRIQMQAYINKGNRPMAMKTFLLCEEVLEREFGIQPLPETKKLYQGILEI